ncbi:hypothetical protein PINS_up013742 [Pythium insidiosum]|nr:hypothetical protein PINS_up013742 [Pythium insidiosum]
MSTLHVATTAPPMAMGAGGGGANLSALARTLDQASISSPPQLGSLDFMEGDDVDDYDELQDDDEEEEDDDEDEDHAREHKAAAMSPAGSNARKSKRERTDSMKAALQPPAAQRARQGSSSGSGGDGDDDFSDASMGDPSSVKLPVKDRSGHAIAGIPRQHLISNALKTAPPAKEKSNPRRWSKQEDESLRLAVERSGERNWKAIAEQVPGRNHTQCLQRWTKVLKPGLIKGHWDPEEDAKLRELVAEGKRNWGQVASLIPGRTSKQCRERWCNHLDPNINKGAYTEEEDRIILEMQAKLGNRWSIIAQQLKGRTEDAVKIRWKSLMRGRKAAGRDEKSSTPKASNTKKERSGSCSDAAASTTSSVAASPPSAIPTAAATPDATIKQEEKAAVPRSKASRSTPTKLKTRAASPVLKAAVDTNLMSPTPSSATAKSSLAETPSSSTMPLQPVSLSPESGCNVGALPMAVASSMNTYVQNINDLMVAGMHNFKMAPGFPMGMGTASSNAQTAAGIMAGNHTNVGVPQPTMHPSNTAAAAYSLPPNMYPAPRGGYTMNPSPSANAYGISIPPNYVMSTSTCLQNSAHAQFALGGPPPPPNSMHPYGTVAFAAGLPPSATTHLSGAPSYVPSNLSIAPPSYTSISQAVPASSGMFGANTAAIGLNANVTSSVLGSEGLTPVSATLSSHPAAPSISSRLLTTPREEWGASQTPRSHLIMTEGHASAYELFHQQRLRLMLQEREKGMTLTSAPSPGQAMLTKELKANKERQKRQEMLQKGWKSAVDAMMSLNNVGGSLPPTWHNQGFHVLLVFTGHSYDR